MAASPYAFLRGAAGIMAADFATLPATGITPVVCGDARFARVYADQVEQDHAAMLTAITRGVLPSTA